MFTLDNHIHNAPIVCAGIYTATRMLKLFYKCDHYAVIMHKSSSMQLHASMVTMYTYRHMHICTHAHILSMHAHIDIQTYIVICIYSHHKVAIICVVHIYVLA